MVNCYLYLTLTTSISGKISLSDDLILMGIMSLGFK
jgi:hypothetical protein